jgi:hypothetical protein
MFYEDIFCRFLLIKLWQAIFLLYNDSNIFQDTESGPRAIWSALSRTIFNLGFQYLQKASVNSGIELDANAELVAFNLTDEEIEYAKLIVNAINLSIKSESKPDPNLDILSKLKGVGAVEESTFEIIGMNDDGGIILPPDVPKEKPKKKVNPIKKFVNLNRGYIILLKLAIWLRIMSKKFRYLVILIYCFKIFCFIFFIDVFDIKYKLFLIYIFSGTFRAEEQELCKKRKVA